VLDDTTLQHLFDLFLNFRFPLRRIPIWPYANRLGTRDYRDVVIICP